MRRTEKEIEFYKELFSKSFSVTVLIGAATIAAMHKEGLSFWVGIGTVGFYWSLLLTAIILKRWKSKIKKLEDNDGDDF